jgi:N-acetylmuramoyl-L-alanine amidase
MYRPVLLKGDYAGSGPTGHERQQMAQREGCLLVVDFHFNSANPTGRGGEVHYKAGSDDSRRFARLMWDSLARIGLPPHGTNSVVEATSAHRSAFINHYAMKTVLLEPLFVSHFDQATWLHDQHNVEALAKAVVDAIKAEVNAGTIGLSPGHAHKTSAPNDTGSACILGDNERRHVLEVVDIVMQALA